MYFLLGIYIFLMLEMTKGKTGKVDIRRPYAQIG